MNRASFGGSLGWTVVVAVVLGVGGYIIGLPAPLALLVAAAAGIAGASLTIGGAVRDDRLPNQQIDLRHGARREIKQLSWNMGGERNRVEAPAVRRLRAIAAARLAPHGVDLDDPRHRAQAEALLGRSVYRVLSVPTAHSPSVLMRCIAVLDRLDTPRENRRTAPATASDPRTAPATAPDPRTAASVPGRTA